MIFLRALVAGWTWVGQHLLTPLLRRCAGRGGWGGQAAQDSSFLLAFFFLSFLTLLIVSPYIAVLLILLDPQPV